MEKSVEQIKQWFRDVWNFEPQEEDIVMYRTDDFQEHYNTQEALATERGGYHTHWKEILRRREI